MNKVQGEFRELRRRHSIMEEQKQGNEEFGFSSEKDCIVKSSIGYGEPAQQKVPEMENEVDPEHNASRLSLFSQPESSTFSPSTNESLLKKETRLIGC